MSQSCAACGSSDSACMGQPESCCVACVTSAGFTHGPEGDPCPERNDHKHVAACASCDYASRRIESGR